jgi:uncharacterized cupin superfamily protein
MPNAMKPVAVVASEAAPRTKLSNYPEPFASRMAGREKRPLGPIFGLTNFAVNLTRLNPGSVSSLRHSHTKQDEFIYILEGTPTLITQAGETLLQPGMCAGFNAGEGGGHHLINRSNQVVVYLEVGDNTAGDSAYYPDDDIEAYRDASGWRFRHKNGEPY